MLTILAAQEGGVTFGELLRDIPHDAPAIVIYVLIIGSVYLIWRGSRKRA